MRRWFPAFLFLLIACGSLAARASDLADQIRAAQSSGEFERAAALYRQLIASGQDTPEIRSNFAAMLHFSGHDREALGQAQIALKLNPNLAGANLIAGVVLSHIGRSGEALPYLQRAHQQDPRGTAPLLALGQVYVSVRDYARSNAAYLEASRLAPDNAEAWYGLGITYRSLADAAIKRSPARTIPPQAKQSLDSALAALSKAVNLQPESRRARLILAESYRDSGKFVDAVNEYQTLLRLSPDDPAVELGLATTYWKAGEIDNAVPALEKVLRKLPDDPEANGIMAEILVRRGDFKGGAPYAKKALKGNPELLQVRFALAKIYLSENQPDLAIAELKMAVAADPDGTYHYLLHRALEMVGREDEAAAALAEFRRLREASHGFPRE